MSPLKPSGWNCLRISIVMTVLASTAVFLRIIARYRTKQSYAAEDWLIIAALLIFGTYNGTLLECIINGGGSLNEAELTLAQLSHVLKNVYVCEILFGCTITIVKFSVLCFYRTIFSVQHFRRTTLAVGIVCLVWFVITEIILIFQCNPIGAMWRFEDWKCMPFGAILFGYELTNLLLDICILCLPIQEIRKLQLPARQKVILSGIFLLGGFVCITCILRMIYLFHPHNDQTVSLPPGLDWSTVELGVAIICACLPTLRPIFPKRPLMSTSLKNWYNSLRGSSKSSQGTHSRGVSRSTYGNKPAPGYNRFDTETPDTIYLTDIVGGRRAGEQNEMGRSSPRDNLSDENITQVV